jgi:hypothetical protein
MATVYLAHDVKHDRKVALKVLHPELAATLGPARQSSARRALVLTHGTQLPAEDADVEIVGSQGVTREVQGHKKGPPHWRPSVLEVAGVSPASPLRAS